MKQRIIEILRGFRTPICEGLDFKLSDENCEKIAEHLIGEGVIVPPVKIGQTCYRVWERELIELKVVSISYKPSPAYYYFIEFDKIGKLCLMEDGSKNEEYSWDDVFLTKEEAEKALVERSKR